MNRQEIVGGCHCGAIRYRAAGPVYHKTHCHCSICRAFGGTLMSWITVEKCNYEVSSGLPKHYHSSSHGLRTFCPDCGAQLTFSPSDDAQMIDIALTTLDSPETFPPDNQIWGSEKLSFLAEMDSLPMSLQGGGNSGLIP